VARVPKVPIANKVEPEGIPSPGVPSRVRMSVVPDPEVTRGGDKTKFRGVVESTTSKVEEEKVEKVETEKLFGVEDQPIVKGTIVITVYENHPYDVEFSGNITGNERDLAWRAMMKQYAVWKARIAKQQEAEIKAKQKLLESEKEGVENVAKHI
jgi:hypothetical protein